MRDAESQKWEGAKGKLVGAVLWALLGVGGCLGGDGRQRGDSSAASADRAAASGRQGPAPRFPDPVSRKTILFAGTSLTAGYGLEPENAFPQLIQQKLDSAGIGFQVVNAGVSGETSSAMLRRIDWLLRQPFDVIVIETGANDGLRGVPVETMEANIQQIIDEVRRVRPHARIVLVQMEALPNLGATYTRRFRTVFPEIAKRNSVVLLPFLLEGVAGVRALNQGDGIHPNEVGARIVAEKAFQALRPLLQ